MNDDQATPGTARSDDTGLGLPVAQSADPIDRVVRLAPKWTLFMLSACALMIAAALVWAFAGEITQTVSRPGVLRDTGYQSVKFTRAGIIATVYVKPGDHLTAGSPILEFSDKEKVLSPTDGYVSAVYKAHGAQVKPGDAAISITNPRLADKVFTLLPTSRMGTIEAGMPVEVEFSNAPAARFGYAKGRIETLSPEPMTSAALAQRAGIAEEVLVAAVGGKPGLAVLIGLDSNLDNPSTLVWTVGKGPDFMPAQGTPVTVNVIISEQRPIDVLFPIKDTAGPAGKATP